MEVKVNIVELASELAHKEVIQYAMRETQCTEEEAEANVVIQAEDDPNSMIYTDYYQDIFTDFYGDFYFMIEKISTPI